MSLKSKSSSNKKKYLNLKSIEGKKLGDSDLDLESSEEELDLTKECYPIGHYISDKPEMINQMFSVIKGNKLRAMLPPILKDCDVDQLKLQCLDQLLGMSEKRISCVIEGEILDSSSESEVEDSDDYSNDKSRSSDCSSDRLDDVDGSYNGGKKGGSYKKMKRKNEGGSEEKAVKTARVEGEAEAAVPEGKTLLEILELEMRARAIRALLNQGGETEVKLEPGLEENGAAESEEVVDLTGGEDEEFLPPRKTQETESDNVTNFEEKIEKSQTAEKPNQEEETAKKLRLQAELELRNKLFKKKIYRTRQQRMENEEDDEKRFERITIKQEPEEEEGPSEIVIEDPEEGEVSSSEDETPVIVKQEVLEPEVPVLEDTEENLLEKGAERITAIHNGSFIPNEVFQTVPLESEVIEDDSEKTETETEGMEVSEKTDGKEIEELEVSEKTDEKEIEEMEVSEKTEETEGDMEMSKNTDDTETGEDFKGDAEELNEDVTWRGRWLQKDGVQKLVKSSKIYAKVKKRLRGEKSKAKEATPPVQEENSDSNSAEQSAASAGVIEGSVTEYLSLQSKVSEENNEGQAGIMKDKNSENETSLQDAQEDSTETRDIKETLQVEEDVVQEEVEQDARVTDYSETNDMMELQEDSSSLTDDT